MADILILGVTNAMGGSASYAALAASFFCSPAIISVVGNDYPKEHLEFLESRNIDLGLVKKEGKSFRWEGYYEFDMNHAKTRKTELNSLEGFRVDIPEKYSGVKHIFLANIDPELQLSALDQLKKPEFVVLDTMNLWINIKKKELLEVIGRADVLLLNDGEARMLFNTTNLVTAANKALALGPKGVIIKKGEHGALMFMDGRHFSAPGYPLENTKDPTGCGDSFGGGLIGYLAKTKDFSERSMRKAIVYGSSIASHTAEDFGVNRLKSLTMKDIEKRYNEMREIREF
ncbi:sugar kinase [Candidatus Woesearchaeota archaeon]|nr:sugar kinase [Candidatus Woesearchaeota archaeon]